MRKLHRPVAALFLVGSLAVAAPAKKKKADPPKSAANEAAIIRVLDAEQDKVAQCVLAGAPQGVWTLNVHVAISITGAGQVMSSRVVLDPELFGAANTSDCVDQVLRAATYPATGAPLIVINRKWTFSMEG